MLSVVALLRGVNVPRRPLRMAQAREALTEHGFTDVESYIQSGNLRVRVAEADTRQVGHRISEVLTELAGFTVPVIPREAADFGRAVAAAAAHPELLPGASRFVAFLDREVGTDQGSAVAGWTGPDARMTMVTPDTVVIDFTGPMHESTLTNQKLERISGAVATWRNIKVASELATRWATR